MQSAVIVQRKPQSAEDVAYFRYYPITKAVIIDSDWINKKGHCCFAVKATITRYDMTESHDELFLFEHATMKDQDKNTVMSFIPYAEPDMEGIPEEEETPNYRDPRCRC